MQFNHILRQNAHIQTARFNKNESAYVQIPSHIWAGIIFACLLSFFTPNPVMTIASILSIPVYAKLTWRKEEPPILFFATLFQWVAITANLFYSNIIGVTLVANFRGVEINLAFWLSLVGLLFLNLGIRLGTARLPKTDFQQIFQSVRLFSIAKIFLMYIGTIALSIVLFSLIERFPNLFQLILAFTGLKWVFFFLLTYSSIAKNRQKAYLVIAMMIEVISGFAGFFAQFKIPFFILFIVYMTLGYRLKLRLILKLITLITLVFYLGIVWTAVKNPYRAYLNQGTGEQIVTRPIKDRFYKLAQLVYELKPKQYQSATLALTQRLSSIEFFALVLQRVPQIFPYENGRITAKVFMHVLMPRIFFPNKPEIHDSELTRKYTGLEINKNTSMSVGYMAEMYIDYGSKNMFLPIFFIGLFLGGIYRFFLSSKKNKLFAYVISVVVLFNAFSYEISLVKLVGMTLTQCIAMAMVLKFLIPHLKIWILENAHRNIKI